MSYLHRNNRTGLGGFLDLCRLATIGNESPGFIWVREGGNTKRVPTSYAAGAPECSGAADAAAEAAGRAARAATTSTTTTVKMAGAGAPGATYQQLQQRIKSLPPWALPVALGGIGLIAVVLLVRK